MSESVSWDQLVAKDQQRLAATHLDRHRRRIKPLDATHVELDGRILVNFCSNNYLGLTHHPKIRAAVEQSLARDGYGSGAAPLITGYGPAHESAENAIAAWKQTETAVLFPSGYQANLAAIQTAAAIGKLGGGVRFLIDKLVHGSLIDAIAGAGQSLRVFPHNGMAKLQRLLEGAEDGVLQVVVTESIFSMDGDAADLVGIAKLRERYRFMLLLDEAHATGVYGRGGAGLADELGLRGSVDVSILTLSKALGGIGGAVCASRVFRDALTNYGRPYLFSTSIPSCMAAAAEAAVGILDDEPERQARVRLLAERFRHEVAKTSHLVSAGDSPIIPIILGDEKKAVEASDKLQTLGLLVLPIRPPTVPKGSSRLRITLSSEHTDEEIARLLQAIGALLQ